jgi:hypothetical protein
MRPDPSLLWTWNRSIDRLPYLAAGVLLFVIKFAIDHTVASVAFGQPWSPLNYLVWPSDRTLTIFDLDAADRSFVLTMLLVSVPFIYVGVLLSLHRLRAAGLPLWLVLLFFVPLVNLLFILALVVLPSGPAVDAEAPVEPPRKAGRYSIQLRVAHKKITYGSPWPAGLLAVLIAAPLTAAGVFVGANLFKSYGFSLFLGAPFALGLVSVLLFGFSRPQPFGACVLVALAAEAVAGVAVLVFALEGAICLIMAAPIFTGLTMAGAGIGYLIQSRPWLEDHAMGLMLAVVLTVPALMAAESAAEPEPELRAVRTEVVIDAPPAAVWRHVVSFPPLAKPDDWLFRCGVAYPLRAEIDGQGVGAVRRCVFSTGTFVEPIEEWDAPRLLKFRVDEQPEPMQEWSLYDIHPAHLDHYLVSKQGQFLLTEMPGGRTRLEGTTWYSNRMWPAWYWHLWSDHIIHRIHGRVLRHIQALAEGERGT